MQEGEEFYLAPMRRGYYRYPDLLTGPLSIEHIAECNEAMSYEDENQMRVQDALKNK